MEGDKHERQCLGLGRQREGVSRCTWDGEEAGLGSNCSGTSSTDGECNSITLHFITIPLHTC